MKQIDIELGMRETIVKYFGESHQNLDVHCGPYTQDTCRYPKSSKIGNIDTAGWPSLCNKRLAAECTFMFKLQLDI